MRKVHAGLLEIIAPRPKCSSIGCRRLLGILSVQALSLFSPPRIMWSGYYRLTIFNRLRGTSQQMPLESYADLPR